MSTQVCSAALIVLPPGVLQKGKNNVVNNVVKSFYYHGALAFNSLPMNIKTLSPKDRFPAISAFYS